jgi:hypothetical protein
MKKTQVEDGSYISMIGLKKTCQAVVDEGFRVNSKDLEGINNKNEFTDELAHMLTLYEKSPKIDRGKNIPPTMIYLYED